MVKIKRKETTEPSKPHGYNKARPPAFGGTPTPPGA